MTIIEKVVILATILGVLGMSTVQTNAPASADPGLPCCYVCDMHPEYCERGCRDC